jgi:3-hydroxybutyryl-CoA dehydrogenase
MGNGIAHVFAQYGFSVVLCDVKPEFVDRALKTIDGNLERQIKKGLLKGEEKQAVLSRIRTSVDLESACKEADLIVEAATENDVVKKDIFRTMDRASKPQAILATNTSSISITEIAAVTRRPGRVIGMHFMNPVPVMKLVEVIRGLSTTDETYAAVKALTEKIEKVPV